MMRRQRGFTLIELLFVFVLIAIVGIIVTIAATDVLDSTTSRKAQANLEQVSIAEQNFATRYGGYTGLPDDLPRITTLTVVSRDSNGPEEVAVALGENGSLGLAVQRNSNTCLLTRLGPPDAGSGQAKLTVTDTASCDAVNALPDGEAEADNGTPVTKAW